MKRVLRSVSLYWVKRASWNVLNVAGRLALPVLFFLGVWTFGHAVSDGALARPGLARLFLNIGNMLSDLVSRYDFWLRSVGL